MKKMKLMQLMIMSGKLLSISLVRITKEYKVFEYILGIIPNLILAAHGVQMHNSFFLPIFLVFAIA